jgi:hypothetical protein
MRDPFLLLTFYFNARGGGGGARARRRVAPRFGAKKLNSVNRCTRMCKRSNLPPVPRSNQRIRAAARQLPWEALYVQSKSGGGGGARDAPRVRKYPRAARLGCSKARWPPGVRQQQPRALLEEQGYPAYLPPFTPELTQALTNPLPSLLLCWNELARWSMPMCAQMATCFAFAGAAR